MSEAIARINAALEGRYQIEHEIGQGGMATVYLADDLKHERKVALKVLKPELAAVVGGDRFVSEIKTTANLQHPHILPLFDSGEADGFLFFVMPFIEGETLGQRIDRDKQLPVDEALGIATAVANALQTAHDAGVVHRDIKPGNILLSRGEPLVADFGIAIAVGAAGGSRLTETGLSVGTPFYMSPEQATGDQSVGPASDTYALACVLYEMLVGEPPYLGNTAQAVLGKIIQGVPVSATAQRKSIPANVDAAIRRALEKIPADRFASAHDFAKALGDPTFRHGETAAEAAAGMHPGPWKKLAVGFAAAAVLALGGVGYLATRPEAPAPVIRYTITFPEEQIPTTSGQAQFGTSMTLSADGSTLVYVGRGQSASQLWTMTRDQLEARALPGTDGGHQPALSPAGTHVAYITATDPRELRTASLGGEPPLTLVGSDIFRLGTAWGEDGYVYYSQQPDGGLARVPENGGDVETLSTPNAEAGETRHAWPDVLPNGKGALVTVQRGNNALSPEDDVGVLDFETGEVHVLFRGLLARYASSGHVVFVTHDGDLRAAPFDQAALEVTGAAVPLLGGMPASERGPDVALSRSGRLVYSPLLLSAIQEPVWVDRNGAVNPVEPGWTIASAIGSGPSLSPDDQSIALSVTSGGVDEVWVKRIGGAFSRLAFDGAGHRRPSWTPDGRFVTYTFFEEGPSNGTIAMKRADGSSATPEVVLDHEDISPATGIWSGDGAWLLVKTNVAPTADIVAVRAGTDEPPVWLLNSDFEENAPALSPDGRFLAYVSNESGQTEVYVRPFPDVNDAKWQISNGGGREPLWSHSGTELFYKSRANQMIAVTAGSRADLNTPVSDVLFSLPVGSGNFPPATTYDVTSDDQRFLMLRAAGSGDSSVIGHYIVVENFLEEMKARIGN